MNHLLEHKKVAIIGGGPGGLTLANLLQQKGIAVKVYERDANQYTRQQGATLDLHHESGLKALSKAGLLEEFKKHYRIGADKLCITNAQATPLWDDHQDEVIADFGNEDFRPEIDRGPLRDILIEALLPETIIWNSHFEKLQPLENGWEIFFKNGNSAYADLVIGVDGANSKIRPYLSNISPIYSGITIVEGNIYHAAQNTPTLWKMTNGGKVFAMGSEKSLILSTKGDGTLSFYTGTKEAENWLQTCAIDFTNKDSVKKWFMERYDDWSDIWLEIFDTDESYFVPRPMYHFPMNQSWETQSNLTIIGDAAHRMPPYAGEGVNMAMQDALELAEALTESNFSSIQDALQAFEKQMLARTSVVTQDTLINTDLIHSENGLAEMLAFFKVENKDEAEIV